MAQQEISMSGSKVAIGLFIPLFIFMVSVGFLPDAMTFISMDYKPSDSPPWYFIMEDLRLGFAASIGFILSIIFTLLFFSKTEVYYHFFIFFSVIWYGNHIGNAFFIFFNTTNIFNSELAETTWQTHEQYLNNSWKSYFFYLLLVISLIGFIALRKKDANSN